jgi:hypothetical protein
MGESQHPDPGSEMNNPNHIFESLETIFSGSGMETVRNRDGKKTDPGSGINIPDPPHCISQRLPEAQENGSFRLMGDQTMTRQADAGSMMS